MKKKIRLWLVLLSSTLLVACGGNDKSDVKEVVVQKASNNKTFTISKRWYSTAQVMRGKKVFKENCAVCHGDKAQGLVSDWKKSLPDGSFPAPPLNGTAHAWHHSKDLLLRTINNGGIPLGGTMPAFKDKLSDKEKEAALAFVTSLWSDEIYNVWSKRN